MTRHRIVPIQWPAAESMRPLRGRPRRGFGQAAIGHLNPQGRRDRMQAALGRGRAHTDSASIFRPSPSPSLTGSAMHSEAVRTS
jgi:hypothetical protein